MDLFKIDSAWLYENREAIPWDAMVGAQVFTATGQGLLVKRIEDRAWPSGPLITLASPGEPRVHDGLYNIQAFNGGPFKSVIPAAAHIQALRSLVDIVDAKQLVKRKIELDRQVAQRQATEEAAFRKRQEESVQQKLLEDFAIRHAEQVEALNASRTFDLLIFDLDDTLLQTGHLESFRGSSFIGPQDARYKNELKEHAKNLEYLIPEGVLLSLQDDFPGLKLSIFTRSPSDYASVLVETCFPRVKWNCVVAFEDVVQTKPRPDGVYLAAKKANVRSSNRIALIGDGRSDVLAAYQAGVQAVLFTLGWGDSWSKKNNPNRSEHFKTCNLMPDAKIVAPEDLRRLVTGPVSFLPCLEAWDVDPALIQRPEVMRVDVQNHFNDLNDAGYPNWVETHSMARYFPSTSSGRYDFSIREQHHSVTKSLLNAKEGIPYPQSWAECCGNYIGGYAFELRRANLSLVVCSIPSSTGSIRPQGKDRLVDLFKSIAEQLDGRCTALLDCDVLQYSPGASSNKTLGKDARFANVRDHLFVADVTTIQGKVVLVLDDVATSGATFFYASKYLKEAGAHSVRCLALAQTIS